MSWGARKSPLGWRPGSGYRVFVRCGLSLIGIARGARVFFGAVLLGVLAGGVLIPSEAHGQLVTERNILDSLLERRDFAPIELNRLDLNRDRLVDVSDLLLFQLRNANLVPSVGFESVQSNFFEGDGTVRVRVTFTKPFAEAVEITFTASGTAEYGTLAQGGDYVIENYDPGTATGVISVPAGAEEAEIVLTIVDDEDASEGEESVQLMLTGGDPRTYFLGAMQTHTLYINDNDGVWTVGMEYLNGPGYESIMIEIVQADGNFTGRVLPNSGLVPAPLETDPGHDGEAWDARIFALDDSIRIEVGPIPVPKELSFFEIEYSRFWVLEAIPGQPTYAFDPRRAFGGEVVEILEPVDGRLGSVVPELSYLRREMRGTFGMVKHPSVVQREDAALVPAN